MAVVNIKTKKLCLLTQFSGKVLHSIYVYLCTQGTSRGGIIVEISRLLFLFDEQLLLVNWIIIIFGQILEFPGIVSPSTTYTTYATLSSYKSWDKSNAKGVIHKLLLVNVAVFYEKRVQVVSGWPKNFQVNLEHTFNTWKNRKMHLQLIFDILYNSSQFRENTFQYTCLLALLLIKCKEWLHTFAFPFISLLLLLLK